MNSICPINVFRTTDTTGTTDTTIWKPGFREGDLLLGSSGNETTNQSAIVVTRGYAMYRNSLKLAWMFLYLSLIHI